MLRVRLTRLGYPKSQVHQTRLLTFFTFAVVILNGLSKSSTPSVISLAVNENDVFMIV
jgi:hypothetical protein